MLIYPSANFYVVNIKSQEVSEFQNQKIEKSLFFNFKNFIVFPNSKLFLSCIYPDQFFFILSVSN